MINNSNVSLAIVKPIKYSNRSPKSMSHFNLRICLRAFQKIEGWVEKLESQQQSYVQRQAEFDAKYY
jgi:hypothetical protein